MMRRNVPARSLVVSALLLSTVGVSFAKRPEHPVDLARLAKDFTAFKPALKRAKECVEFFRAEKDGGAQMDDLPAADKLPTYQKCSTDLRDAVARYVKASGPLDAESIKGAITTPVGMSLWLAWSLADARLAAEDILPTTDVHFRWVLVNDGTSQEAAAPANIASDMLDQAKAAAQGGRPEVKALASDDVFASLTLVDSGGKSWLGDVQAALNDNEISGHNYLFDDIATANKMFAHDHYSAWVQAVLPLGGKPAHTDLAGGLVLVKRIDDMETVCTKSVNTGTVNFQVTGSDTITGTAVKACAQTGKVKASYWSGPFIVSKSTADFLKTQGGAGKRIALNCGRGDSNISSKAPIPKATLTDGMIVKDAGSGVYAAYLPNKWVTPTRMDETGIRWCAPTQVYVGPGAPDAKDNPPPAKLGKLVMYYGLDLTK